MTEWLPGIAATVVGAIALGVLAWFFTPLKNRLEPRRMQVSGDHGLKLQVCGTSAEMNGMRPEDMLGLQPSWLTDSDFYFPNGVPGDGPASPPEWQEWSKAHGGEGASFRHVLLRIQATQDRTVLLLPPRVHVVRTDVSSGVICGPERPGGGNGLMCRQFFVDLDQEVPEARYFGDEQGETPQFVMRKGDSEAFVLIARAIVGRYEWYVDLPCLVEGVEVTLTAMHHGRPFVTVGAQGVDRWWWIWDQKRWMEPPW